MLTIFLLLAAFLFFALAAFNFAFSPRINPLGVGLALLTLAQLWPLFGTFND